MDKIMSDISGIAASIVGLAMIYVLFSARNTSQVISSATGGFAADLAAAMGGTVQNPQLGSNYGASSMNAPLSP